MSFRPLPSSFSTLEGLTLNQDQIAWVSRCQTFLLREIPTAWRDDVRVTWVEEGCVWVETGQGMLAAKLRQLTPRLLAALPQQSAPWLELKIRITPHSRPKPRQSQLLQPSTLQEFEQLAQQLPQGPLRQALETLLLERKTR